MTINNLCKAAGKEPIFKYTDKTMRIALNIGGIFCSSSEQFGIMIDYFYMMFYENLEHIKSLVSDEVVRKDENYQCIFRVKDMRTDIRHDYDHGKKKDIDKKRRDIITCYNHYANKPTLVSQRDYVTLQRKMYDEFLVLEEHLIQLVGSMVSLEA